MIDLLRKGSRDSLDVEVSEGEILSGVRSQSKTTSIKRLVSKYSRTTSFASAMSWLLLCFDRRFRFRIELPEPPSKTGDLPAVAKVSTEMRARGVGDADLAVLSAVGDQLTAQDRQRDPIPRSAPTGRYPRSRLDPTGRGNQDPRSVLLLDPIG